MKVSSISTNHFSLSYRKNNHKTSNILYNKGWKNKDNKLEGAVEIFNMPERDLNGKVFSDRYIAGMDPYDDDVSETTSLGSIFILDLWLDKIVAEYTGRPMFADDFYEICRRICLFYNARMNYENNKKNSVLVSNYYFIISN